MKIALLGTGFGQAHAAAYAERPDVDEVVVFGRTAGKLAKISGQFGFATTTDLEYTDDGERPIDLPTAGPPYAAMIDHVLACLAGHADNLIEPVSALPALELTLDVHQRLTHAAG